MVEGVTGDLGLMPITPIGFLGFPFYPFPVPAMFSAPVLAVLIEHMFLFAKQLFVE